MNAKFISIITLSLLTLYGCNSNQVGSTPSNLANKSVSQYSSITNSTQQDNDLPISPRIVLNPDSSLESGDFEASRLASLKDPFYSVGQLKTLNGRQFANCTATWLGELESDTYILTAAHCIPYKNKVTIINSTFINWDGQIIASGNGKAYVKEELLSDGWNAATDIAILVLPKKATPLNSSGEPVASPIFYDGSDENDKAVELVGYGMMLKGKKPPLPVKDPRYGRLWGKSKISPLPKLKNIQDFALGAKYEYSGITDNWAKVTFGDSGSAWWQDHAGIKTIIAVTCCGDPTYGSGARISKNVDWIKNIYPEAKFLSEVITEPESLPAIISGSLTDNQVRKVPVIANEKYVVEYSLTDTSDLFIPGIGILGINEDGKHLIQDVHEGTAKRSFCFTPQSNSVTIAFRGDTQVNYQIDLVKAARLNAIGKGC